MGTKIKASIAEQLNAAQLAINNSLASPQVRAAVAEYGYNEQRFNEGRALYTAALAAFNERKASAGGQKDTTASLQKKEREAQDAYQALAQVCRAIFGKERARLAALGLRGTMPRTTAAFIASGYSLFDNAMNLAEIRSALAEYGYTQTKLQSERAKIEAFDQANQAQEAAKGMAQHRTREQEQALKAMNDWVSQYLRIAKVALRGQRELLEKLGVLARSVKTPAQRNPQKTGPATTGA